MKRTRLAWLWLFIVLPGFTAAAPGDSDVVRTEHKFARVTFSIGCSAATRNEDRRDLKRSDRAVGYFPQIECIDAGKQVEGVKLVAIAIGQNEKLGIFDVILKLDSGSALKLAKLTDQGNPQQLVLLVKGRAVVAGFNEAPFHGDKFFITANTLDEARKTADLFDE